MSGSTVLAAEVSEQVHNVQIEIVSVLVAAVFVALAAFLALAETSLVNTSLARARALEEEGRRGAGVLRRLLEQRERRLDPILLLVLVCHLTAGALVGIVADAYFGPAGVAASVLALVMIIFVLAEAAPKTYALQHPTRVALFTAPVVNVLARIPPVRWATRAMIGVSNALIPGKGHPTGAAPSEEELLAMADEAVEADVIEVEERALIRSIIDFGDTVVREVMVPRPSMVTIGADSGLDEAMEAVIKHGYSRIPVSDEDIDDVIGLVYAKDLMRAAAQNGGSAELRGLLRPARFTPEVKRVAELMREMQAEKYHMAVVIDEYGGTAGLVTLEDLIEELVGEIVDEFDVEDPLLEPMPNGDTRVNARMAIDELNELLHLEPPLPVGNGDYDTLGGLVGHTLGRAPVEGEVVDVEGHQLRAERVQGRRVGRIRITPRSAGAASDEVDR